MFIKDTEISKRSFFAKLVGAELRESIRFKNLKIKSKSENISLKTGIQCARTLDIQERDGFPFMARCFPARSTPAGNVREGYC